MGKVFTVASKRTAPQQHCRQETIPERIPFFFMSYKIDVKCGQGTAH